MTTGTGTTTDWAVLAARAADDKLGQDTVVIDVGDVLAVTDAFVITSGDNVRQVRAIVDEIQRVLREAGGPKPLRTEGLDTAEWVLLDYGAFVVHVFDRATRDYYELERLWSDRPRIAWQTA
jgi:ribosome-associated protein